MSVTQSPPPGVSPATGADRMSRRAWGVLLVLCGAVFLEGVDVSMMGVALPSIRAELEMSTGSLQWVVSPEAVLDGYRAALVVPFVPALLGVAVSAVGLHAGGGRAVVGGCEA